jgi:outer membrane protein assembly factor BamD (BamD/ComL family)
MYLNAGRAYYMAGDKESALRHFNTIIEKFANSKEKQEAQYYKELLS